MSKKVDFEILGYQKSSKRGTYLLSVRINNSVGHHIVLNKVQYRPNSNYIYVPNYHASGFSVQLNDSLVVRIRDSAKNLFQVETVKKPEEETLFTLSNQIKGKRQDA